MANEGYHEAKEELSDATRDMHRAIVSLMEELEAVDWYNQRVDACKDAELKAILAHNRDEEKEHAAIVPEDLLGAVAVMHVPVDDHHALEPVVRKRVRGRHRDVVEQAEPHRAG